MKIINIHQREYNQPSSVISEILNTLSSHNDRVWPKESWPPMILSNGLEPKSAGGHGPIGYYVSKYEDGKLIEFTFTKPKEFIGTHKFEVIENTEEKTQLRHTIHMDLNLKGIATWFFAIKWLHDSLLEDCLDKVQNHFSEKHVHSKHNFWVKTLRKLLKKNEK